MGARIILVARNKSRAEMTLARLARSASGVAHSMYFGEVVVDRQHFGALLRKAQNRGTAIAQPFARRLTRAYYDGDLVLETHANLGGITRLPLDVYEHAHTWKRICASFKNRTKPYSTNGRAGPGLVNLFRLDGEAEAAFRQG
jgi:hypothetical protein